MPESPRPQSPQTITNQVLALTQAVVRIEAAVAELSERQGQMMRELMSVRRELQALNNASHEARKQLASIPDIARAAAEDAAEDTGQHNRLELERKLAEFRAAEALERKDSIKVQYRRLDDRRWQLILALITASIGTVVGFLASHMLH